MRVLERRVVEAGGREGSRLSKEGEQAGVSWTSPDSVEVRLKMGAEAWALLERAMEGARRAAEGTALLTDAEALEAVARDALARQQEAGGEPSDPRRNVVLYECQTCGRTELETGRGPIELGAGAAAALGCGATERDLRSEGRIVKRGGPIPAQVKRAVRLRDRDRCRVPGCGRRRYVDVHHIERQRTGGVHSRGNCCELCTTHHRQLHGGQLRVEGDADAELRFFDEDGDRIIEGRAAVDAGVTQGGSGRAARDIWDVADLGAAAVTQGGSPAPGTAVDGINDEDSEPCLEPEAIELLKTMGSRGGWHPDALHAASSMTFKDVLRALLDLVLAGRVRETYHGYEAVM